MTTEWIVEEGGNDRFPFRIRIVQDGRIVLAVRAQRAWPGPGASVFCLRDDAADACEPRSLRERVPVLHVRRLGRKLSVTLDRPRQKRCEFLKTERKRRDGGGAVEQIFFRTQQSTEGHASRGRVELVPQRDLEIAVDAMERYPWRFPGATIRRRRLPVGDYALLDAERIVAVVERKSLANFLSDVGSIKVLHQQLAELGAQPRAAFVVEASYADLTNPKRIARWPSSHLLRVVAELAALHPSVHFVWPGNRKLANAWAQHFFAATAAAKAQPLADIVREPVLAFRDAPPQVDLDTRIRRGALYDLADGFAFGELRALAPGASDGRIRRVLHQLRDEGHLRCDGRGRSARWVRTPTAEDAEVARFDVGDGARKQ